MRSWLFGLCVVACTGDDSVLPQDSGGGPAPDPCLDALDLFQWSLAVVRQDDEVLHDFRSGVNAAGEWDMVGVLAAYGADDCATGFRIEQADGVVFDIGICVDNGPALSFDLPVGAQVQGWFLSRETTRGEFQLALADADGPLVALHATAEDTDLLQGLGAELGPDILECLDGEAYTQLVVAIDGAEVSVDSGSSGELKTEAGVRWSVRALAAARGLPQRHLSGWAGAHYAAIREP